MKKISLIVALITVLLASCVKSEDKSPQPQKPTPIVDTILTDEKMVGKWEVIYGSWISAYGPDASMTRWVKDQGEYNHQGILTHKWNPETDVSYIIFTSDYSFSHADINGTPDCYMLSGILPPTGRWSVPDRMKLKLTSTDLYTVPTTFTDTAWTYTYKDSSITMFREIWTPTHKDSSLTQLNLILKKI